MRLCTFSIVGCDLERQEWGVAVASKFLAAGALVCWARAGAGAVATQAMAKVGFGPDGLAMLERRKSAQQTLSALLEHDQAAPDRQLGIVDWQGNTAAHTGERCIDWAGHLHGASYACQGNLLTGRATLEAMAERFEHTQGELADRLMAALRAGDQAGGDRRGKQSAALLVVRPEGGYGGDTDRYLDLRVDDDPEPVKRLESLVATHHIFFGESPPEEQLPIEGELATELERLTQRLGYLKAEVDGRWGEQAQQAFWALIGNENLEQRWSLSESPDRIDMSTLEYLRQRFAA